MDFGEFGAAGGLFIVLVHWIHAIAAVAWVGGSAFFALIIRPALTADPDGMGRVMGRLTGPYRELVDVSIIAITVSGLVLMFDRLTGDDASGPARPSGCRVQPVERSAKRHAGRTGAERGRR